MTENVTPSPYPLPSRAREYRKNILLKEEGVSEESPLERDGIVRKIGYFRIFVSWVRSPGSFS